MSQPEVPAHVRALLDEELARGMSVNDALNKAGLRVVASDPAQMAVGHKVVDGAGNVFGFVYGAGPWAATGSSKGWEDRWRRREVPIGRLPNAACASDLRRLQEHFPSVRGALTVGGSRVDKLLRGLGVGSELYRRNVRAAAAEGYALAPSTCIDTGKQEGQTSADALRVWERLKREFPHEGRLVWGGR